ncbi:MAG: gas vesicle structural protein [Pseudonocardiales bacterium]|jgi:hypothetical protein|nr:gas vesicle structural protein [Pseudonocardiales bacterium]
MTMSMQPASRASRPAGLAEVLDIVLDKGIVIDAYVRLALVGIEILTLDARIVIASVDTYLRFAEATNRLDLQPREQAAGLPGLMNELTEGGAKRKTKGALGGVKESAKDALSSLRGNDQDQEQDQGQDEDESRSAPAERSASKARRGDGG